LSNNGGMKAARLYTILMISPGIAAAQVGHDSSIAPVFSTDFASRDAASSSATLSYIVAHFPYGGSWGTQVWAANSGSGSASATLKFFNPSGQPVSVPLEGVGSQESQSFTVAPNQVHVLGSDPAMRNVGAIQVAWGILTSNVPLNVFSLFDTGPSEDTITGAVGAQSTQPQKTFRFPIAVGGPLGYNAGMGIANPNNSDTTFIVKVLNSDGSTKGTFQQTLHANNQTLFVLTNLPGISFNTSTVFNGSVAVCATQMVGLVTVGFEGGQAFFTTSVTNDPCP